MAIGGRIVVCPGEYRGHWSLAADVELIGAGNGDDPETSTILSGGSQPASVPVLLINSVAITASFTNVRLTGGYNNGLGGGFFIFRDGSDVTFRDCVLTQNRGFGGGAGYVAKGKGTFERCEITYNYAELAGGGLIASTIMNVTDTLIANNSGGRGGGLYVDGFKTTLSPTVTITRNVARDGNSYGGGIEMTSEGVIDLNGARVIDNDPNNCLGIVCPA
jgi:hypothetical protein